MKKIIKFLHLARCMAENSDVYKYKHGACVVKKGKILAVGYNQYKSHPLQKMYNKTAKTSKTANDPYYVHAEVKALSKLKDMDLSDCEIYVYRLNCQGQNSISRPCNACMAAIVESGIKKIIYTTDTGYAEEYIYKNIINAVEAENFDIKKIIKKNKVS